MSSIHTRWMDEMEARSRQPKHDLHAAMLNQKKAETPSETKQIRKINLFTGVEITFEEKMFDNSTYNDVFRGRDGFEQHMLPEQESSIERFNRMFEGYVKANGLKREYEHTVRKDGVVVMYFSGKANAWTKVFLAECDMLTSVRYGSMKTDATFKPSKAKAA